MIHPQLRRSLLYVPGNMPAMLQNIPIFSCDVCIIDLEDAVPRTEKDTARLLSRRFIEGYTQRNKEVYVRINGLDTPYFRDDLAQILPAMPDGIRLPKCEHPSHLRRIDDLLTEFEEYLGCEIGRFKVIASVESAQGIINVNETARASSRLVALGFSAEDYTANLQIDRPKTGEHLVVPRQLLLMACRAADIQAIDTVWADASDQEGFRRECEHIKVLGFDGKSLINPRQIDVLHEVLAPKPDEIDYALQVVDAIKGAREQGTGVVSLGGKMIDAPVVARAVRVLLSAKSLGLVDTDIDEQVIYGDADS
ncbi:MAG: citrate lyase subunit beta [Phycisphaerales bacterium]|nr:citrate lyase subunit beta [Phycisphaerales bacterium]